MGASQWKPLIIVLAVATLFRTWGALDVPFYIGDEALCVPAAKNFVASGTRWEWRNPPVNALILGGTIALFGDNALGWRVSGIVLGIGSVLLLYLVALRLHPTGRVPLLAGALLGFDPFHVHFSRTVSGETPVVFFFLLFLFAILEYTERDMGTPALALAGVAAGLTMATKAYFVFAIPFAAAYAFHREGSRRPGGVARRGLEFLATLVLLPAGIFLLSYAHWFGRGYALPDLFRLVSDAWWVFDHDYRFQNEEVLALGGAPWEWFVRPFSFGHQIFRDATHGRISLEINNPIFRMMVLPALGWVAFQAIRGRRLVGLAAPVLFLSIYALIFGVSRPFNSYSALPLLPLAYLALAEAVVMVGERLGRERGISTAFLGGTFVSGCYLFPISTGMLVPTAIYAPVLAFTTFF